MRRSAGKKTQRQPAPVLQNIGSFAKHFCMNCEANQSQEAAELSVDDLMMNTVFATIEQSIGSAMKESDEGPGPQHGKRRRVKDPTKASESSTGTQQARPPIQSHETINKMLKSNPFELIER